MTASSVATVPVREEGDLATAYRLLWLAVIFDFLAFGVGFEWDKRWHATHAFEDFFSPPHLFIYAVHLCATITLGYIAFTPGLRRWFGSTFRLPLVPFPIPGAIGPGRRGVRRRCTRRDVRRDMAFILRPRRDELVVPHSMLGWGLFIAFLGITSCRIALREWRPIGWPSAIVFGFLIAATSADRSAGPAREQPIARGDPLRLAHPGSRRGARLQHTTRIYLAADIHRYNPLFVPLISLSAVLTLGLLHHFSPGRWLMVGLAALLSWTSTLIPYVVPAVIVAIGGNRQGSPACGSSRGSASHSPRRRSRVGTPGGPLVGTLLFIVGSLLADRIWRVVVVPTRRGVIGLTTLAGIVMPALTGIVDLSLRARIP